MVVTTSIIITDFQICYDEAMTKYVALIRGIGPTNPNMRSEKLKAFFEELGFDNVQTLITSGNVLFESSDNNISKMEELIEKTLPEKLGFNSTTIIRSQSELQSLVDDGPYSEYEHGKKTYLLVTFFKQPKKIEFKLPYQPENKPYKLVAAKDTVIYGIVDTTSGKTPDYMVWLEKQFGKNITSRTLKTIQKIIDKMKLQ